MSTDNNMHSFHKGREVIYSVLSHLFLDVPDDKQYKMLEDVFSAFKLIASDSDDLRMKSGIDTLDIFVTNLTTLKGDKLAEFKLDHARAYTQLFCLSATVPLSESYYTSVEQLVMQESRDDALKIYKANKFKMEIESNEPEDHLSYELMFMSYLASLSADSLDDEKQLQELYLLQSSFLKGHILNWLNDFIGKLEVQPASKDFYLPLSHFLLSFIMSDIEFLG